MHQNFPNSYVPLHINGVANGMSIHAHDLMGSMVDVSEAFKLRDPIFSLLSKAFLQFCYNHYLKPYNRRPKLHQEDVLAFPVHDRGHLINGLDHIEGRTFMYNVGE